MYNDEDIIYYMGFAYVGYVMWLGLSTLQYKRSSIVRSERRTALKWQVKQRDNHTCQTCGKSEDLNIHHIQHKSEGGSNELHNLITLCTQCHCKCHSRLSRIITSGVDPRHYRELFTP